MRRADGSNAIERYDVRTGAVATVARVSPNVTAVSVGNKGVVYADGSAISMLDTSGTPQVLWRSTGRPFGVSIEGKGVVVDDADELWKVGVNVFERYTGPYTDDMKPFVEVMLNKRVAVRIKPERKRSWDHRKLGLPSTGAPGGTTMTAPNRRSR